MKKLGVLLTKRILIKLKFVTRNLEEIVKHFMLVIAEMA